MKELTKAEEQVMQILWKIDRGMVKEILDHFPNPKPAYNTVSTIVRILETKNMIGHKAYGKTHEYFPLISKEDYIKHLSKGMIKNYFDGSLKNMLSFFINEDKISVNDLDDIFKLINRKS